VTNRVGAATWLDADHRRHAVCELAIRDLKADGGLAHLPSGRFNANAAWLLAATLAHNLLRWTASLGLGVRDQQTVAKTLRRTLLMLPGAAHPLRAAMDAAPAHRMALGALVHHGAGAAALHPAPDLTRPSQSRRSLVGARPTRSTPAQPASITDPWPGTAPLHPAQSPPAAWVAVAHAITPPRPQHRPHNPLTQNRIGGSRLRPAGDGPSAAADHG
jgi:hypothetical protein